MWKWGVGGNGVLGALNGHLVVIDGHSVVKKLTPCPSLDLIRPSGTFSLKKGEGNRNGVFGKERGAKGWIF